MKPPNKLKATIGDMLEWAANWNGKTTAKRQALISQILSQVSYLDRVRDFPWTARNWADKAWHDIQAIGVQDRLELSCEPKKAITVTMQQFRRACGWLKLNLHKVNGRLVITRQPMTKAQEQRMLSEMPPAERGESSPEFGFEIDTNAKLHV